MRAALFFGSRMWGDQTAIRNAVMTLPADSVVVHGDAEGTDVYAGNVARHRGLPVVKVPYLYARGRRGGPMRNKVMADMLAAWAAGGLKVHAFGFIRAHSAGSEHMLKLCRDQHIPVLVQRTD